LLNDKRKVLKEHYESKVKNRVIKEHYESKVKK